jgi:hypothetical protein
MDSLAPLYLEQDDDEPITEVMNRPTVSVHELPAVLCVEKSPPCCA